MVARSIVVVHMLVALCACAGGEESGLSRGFGGSAPPLTTADNSASDPTAGTTAGTTAETSDPIRPDMGVMSTSTVDPSATTGVDPGTTAADASSSTGPMIVCGDGVIEGTEECEGADLNGQDCVSLGFSGGTLACASCTLDKSLCVSESCGDAIINGGEECDCGQQGSPCAPDQLGAQTCTNLVSPNGGNFHGGTLTCASPQSCTFNKTQCQYCGDGVRNGPEACEGADLGGQTCQNLGFNGGGSLKCSASCAHDTSGCVNIVCGNGQCQQGEDSCNCPADCPDDPSSCSPCQCGLNGGNCWCDDSCVIFDDCCFNGPC